MNGLVDFDSTTLRCSHKLKPEVKLSQYIDYQQIWLVTVDKFPRFTISSGFQISQIYVFSLQEKFTGRFIPHHSHPFAADNVFPFGDTRRDLNLLVNISPDKSGSFLPWDTLPALYLVPEVNVRTLSTFRKFIHFPVTNRKRECWGWKSCHLILLFDYHWQMSNKFKSDSIVLKYVESHVEINIDSHSVGGRLGIVSRIIFFFSELGTVLSNY